MSKSDGYRKARLRGKFAAKLYENGKLVSRFTLGTDNEDAADRLITQLNVERDRQRLPERLTVRDLYALYIEDRRRDGIASAQRISEVIKFIDDDFGGLYPEDITKEICLSHIKARQARGLSNATIRTRLSYLTSALQFAFDAKYISAKPKIWKPPAPRAQSGFITKPEAKRLIESAETTPHLWLFIILALSTAGRASHILQLTWSRVDLNARIIHLDDPDRYETQKGRATVPINDMALKALTLAKKVALTSYVIEYQEKPVKSVKNAFSKAVKRANLNDVTIKILRKTSAVWMAQANTPMEKIAEYLGHTNVETTRKHYAKYAPNYLDQGASAVDIDLD